MKYLMRLFPAGHLVISVLFVVCAATLILFALQDLWMLVRPAEAIPDIRRSTRCSMRSRF